MPGRARREGNGRITKASGRTTRKGGPAVCCSSGLTLAASFPRRGRWPSHRPHGGARLLEMTVVGKRVEIQKQDSHSFPERPWKSLTRFPHFTQARTREPRGKATPAFRTRTPAEYISLGEVKTKTQTQKVTPLRFCSVSSGAAGNRGAF